MARNIILCFDGTNNEYAATNTNVVKMYAMLDRTTADQLMYYQPGIGTFPPPGVWGKLKGWLVTKLDLAIAWLLKEHATAGYRFLMSHYQPGDRIFVFGFSRGAFTARVLAGMVHKVGLLTAGNEELVDFAWNTYGKEHAPPVYDGFKRTFSRDVQIHFLGLWDTVSSVGWAWHPEHLPNTFTNPSVHVVRHAMAIDERRAQFPQNLWSPNPGAGQDVLQVWFPGVHCDVGGGYLERESGLSKLALQWMCSEAMVHGLKLDAQMITTVIPTTDNDYYAAPSFRARKHESLKGFWWWLVEYIPLPRKDPTKGYKVGWVLHRGRSRFIADKANVHASVFQRKDAGVDGYSPSNLPSDCIRIA